MTNPDYQRGYNRGRASVNPELDRYRKAVERAEERALNAEAGKFGPCQSCVRWTRNEQCHWGFCEFPKVIGIGDTNWWGDPGTKVCTQENFGCVRFSKRTPGA